MGTRPPVNNGMAILTEFFRLTEQHQGSKVVSYLEKGRIPKATAGLAAEANKAPTFEDFQKDFLRHIKHGVYWHWTQDPNFTIDPTKGPRDLSSMAMTATESPGDLMITSDLEGWADYGEGGVGRPYAALIDMTTVPREKYGQNNRGFGNEMYIENAIQSGARVAKVYDRRGAFKYDRYARSFLPQSPMELLKFYQVATGRSD